MEFVRPGSAATPVRSDPLFVVDGVGYNDLTRGPGRYPDTALPGKDGNFAIAGHRTTYDAPFYDLDELRQGDEIHITDRSGTKHVYAFAERRIVEPTAAWVLADEPLDGATATLTLTTCHPRFSAAQRMVVFAELVSR
jgi:sortase A